MEQTILEKNLEMFGRFNPPIVELARNVDLKGVDFCRTKKDELNLQIEVDGKIHALHSQDGALDEVKKWISYQINLNIDALFIYGVGLGYYYDGLKEWLHSDEKRMIIFLEDDERVIHRFLETEKATEILNDPQVILSAFLLDPNNAFNSFETQFRWFMFALSKHTCRLVTLPIYEFLHHRTSWALSKLFTLLYTKVQMHIDVLFNSCFYEEFPNFYQNMPYIYQNYSAEKLYGLFPNIPAIICGAGPSLGKHFTILKSLEDKALIFGAGSSLNALSAHYVTANFGGGIDPTPTQKSRFVTNFAYEMPLFYLNRFNHEAFLTSRGSKLYVKGTIGFRISDWFEEQFGLKTDFRGDEDFGVSTSTFLLAVSRRLGSKQIILSGMDLAYTTSKRYAPGINAHPTDNIMERRWVALDGSGRTGIPDVNVKGEEIQTTNIWKYESHFYTEFRTLHPEVTITNTSEGGLRIEQVEHRPLQQVADEICKRSYDMYGRVNACIQNSKFQFPFSVVKKAFEEWKESCIKVQEYSEEALKEFDKVKGELENEGDNRVSVWTEKAKEILDKLQGETVFKVLFGELYRQLSFTFMLDQCKLDCHRERYTHKERMTQFLNFEKMRFEILKTWGLWHQIASEDTITLFQKHQKLLDDHQVTNDYPKPQKSETDVYTYDNRTLRIHDEEMGLHFDIPFDPSPITDEKIAKALSESSNTVIEVVEEKEGQWDGQYRIYYPSKKLLGQCFYLQGKMHGPSRFYSEEGTLLSETWFVNGKRQGKCWYYYWTGDLYCLQRFRDGLLDGRQEYLYSTGNIKTLLNYKRGVLDGEVILYFSNGQKDRELHFQDGKLHGVERHWEKNGQLILESHYIEGKPVETSRSWYPNGRIAKQFVYHDSEHFDHYEWDPAGNLKIKEIYMGEDIFEGLKKKSQQITDTIEQLKDKLEKLKDQNK